MAERLKALKESKEKGEVLEFYGNDDPKCPHCGESHSVMENEWFELFQEGEHTVSCPDCGLDFTIETSISFSFDTEDQPDEDEA